VDIIHGTPILDVKPYIPEYDYEPKKKTFFFTYIGVDIIHGTPILDIKPYILEYDYEPKKKTFFFTYIGVDIIHGTPILDIKPYIPEYDYEPNEACVRVPEWISRPPISTLQVNFSRSFFLSFFLFFSRVFPPFPI